MPSSQVRPLPYNSDFSPKGLVNYDYREFEEKCIEVETSFNILGRLWGVSLISGALRVGMGLSLALFPLLLATAHLVHAVFNRIFSEKEEAALALEYCKRNLNYAGHALANVLRGGCEMFQLGAFFKLDPKNQIYNYPTTTSDSYYDEDTIELQAPRPSYRDDDYPDYLADSLELIGPQAGRDDDAEGYPESLASSQEF